MPPLPNERFKVTRLEKVKTDNYSFARFENNRYGTAPEYNKYEEVVVHKRCYEQAAQPIIDWIKYLEAITKKPNAL